MCIWRQLLYLIELNIDICRYSKCHPWLLWIELLSEIPLLQVHRNTVMVAFKLVSLHFNPVDLLLQIYAKLELNEISNVILGGGKLYNDIYYCTRFNLNIFSTNSIISLCVTLFVKHELLCFYKYVFILFVNIFK